jgi:hypothetical protein
LIQMLHVARMLAEDLLEGDLPAPADVPEMELVEEEEIAEGSDGGHQGGGEEPQSPVGHGQSEDEEDRESDEPTAAKGHARFPVPHDRVHVGFGRKQDEERDGQAGCAPGEAEESEDGDEEQRVPAEQPMEREEGAADLRPVPLEETRPLRDRDPFPERDPPVRELRRGAQEEPGGEGPQVQEAGERWRRAGGTSCGAGIASPGGEADHQIGDRQEQDEPVLPANHRRHPAHESEEEVGGGRAPVLGAVPEDDEEGDTERCRHMRVIALDELVIEERTPEPDGDGGVERRPGPRPGRREAPAQGERRQTETGRGDVDVEHVHE